MGACGHDKGDFMHLLTRLSTVAAFAVLAGCATQGSAPAGPPGKHLIYRDGNGQVIRQFDYPDDAFCRRVQAMAGRGARCEAESAAAKTSAHATLRYNPPGVMVHGHYADMARCRADTKTMSAGVELVSACAAQ
jgi:hypothetical protein